MALEGGEWSAARPGRTLPPENPVPILQKAGWAPGPVWTGRKSRPHWDSIPDRPARSQSLYRLSYPAHSTKKDCFIYKTKVRKLLRNSLAKYFVFNHTAVHVVNWRPTYCTNRVTDIYCALLCSWYAKCTPLIKCTVFCPLLKSSLYAANKSTEQL